MEIILIDHNNIKYFSYLIGDVILPGQGAVGVVDNGVPVAAGLFSADDPVCVLDWIAVDEGRRRRGVGSFLFGSVKSVFEERQYSDFLSFYDGTEENTCFLRSLGFVCAPSLSMYAVSCESLRNSEKCGMMISKFLGHETISADKITKKQRKELCDLIEESGFAMELAEPGAYDPEWSFAIVSGDGLNGALLARQSGEDIYVSLLVTDEDDKTNPLKLFASFLDRLKDSERRLGDVVFLGANDSLVDFMNKFLEDETMLRKTSGAWEAEMKIGENNNATEI